MSKVTELLNKIEHFEINGDDIRFYERPVVIPINTPRGEIGRYFQDLPIEAQSKQKDFRKLANRDFGTVWLGKRTNRVDIRPEDFVSDKPLTVKIVTDHGYKGRETYGFEVPDLDEKYLTDDYILIWLPQVTVKQSLL